jgi:hypothetical protein
VRDAIAKKMFRRLLIALWLGAASVSMAATSSSLVRAASAVTQQESFPTPEQAVDALVAANRATRMGELLAILGPDGAKLIHSGDPVADRRGRERFVAAYDEAHKLELEGQDKAILIVGKEDWPFPIPLVREQAGWRFETKAGAQEILDRRIGRNELSVIEVCRAFVEAQRDYAARRLRAGGPAEYAPRFMSTAGSHDGLYWPTKPGEDREPLRPAHCWRPGQGLWQRYPVRTSAALLRLLLFEF